MYCNNCGKRIGKTEKYCASCGTPLTGVKVSTQNIAKNENVLTKFIGAVVFILVAIIVASIVKVGVSQLSGHLSSSDNSSKSQLIIDAVNELKTDMTLPQQLDEITTLVDVTAEANAIRYHYILSDVDTTAFTTSDLKTNLITNVCSNKQTKETINLGINMEYSYVVDATNQRYFVTISKTDCL